MCPYIRRPVLPGFAFPPADEPGPWDDAPAALAEMKKAHDAIEGNCVNPFTPVLSEYMALVVRGLQTRELVAVRVNCNRIVEIVFEMPVGTYKWVPTTDEGTGE